VVANKGKIDVKEWRQQMINRGYKQGGGFLVRANAGSPKPNFGEGDDLYERLHKDQEAKEKKFQTLKGKYEQQDMKECTFAPKVNKRRIRSPRPPETNPLEEQRTPEQT